MKYKHSILSLLFIFCFSSVVQASLMDTAVPVLTPSTEILRNYVVGFNSLRLGKIVSYEAGTDRVMVKTTGEHYNLVVPFDDKAEFSIAKMSYDVNSYFPGAGGRDRMKGLSASLNIVWPTFEKPVAGINKWGLEYRYLKGSRSNEVNYPALPGEAS